MWLGAAEAYGCGGIEGGDGDVDHVARVGDTAASCRRVTAQMAVQLDQASSR